MNALTISAGIVPAMEMEELFAGQKINLHHLIIHDHGARRPVIVEEVYRFIRVLSFSQKKKLMKTWREKRVIFAKDLQSTSVENWLKEITPQLAFHSGNRIYSQEFLQHVTIGLLNPHIGLLPAFRGRNVMEWSILEGAPTGVTLFLLDAGIDTGKILFFEPVDVTQCNNIEDAKQHLFALRNKLYLKSFLQIASGKWELMENPMDAGKRFYPMSDLMLRCVESTFTESKCKDKS